MAPRLRQGLFAAALIATVVAAYLVGEPEEPAETAPQARGALHPGAASGAPFAGGAASAAQRRESFAAEGADLFAARSWRPPPAEAPPSAPTAPPLPFVYAGKMEEGGQTVLFLSWQNRTLLVRQGEVINGSYRVDRITPFNAEFTYLPLKQHQSLNLAQ